MLPSGYIHISRSRKSSICKHEHDAQSFLSGFTSSLLTVLQGQFEDLHTIETQRRSYARKLRRQQAARDSHVQASDRADLEVSPQRTTRLLAALSQWLACPQVDIETAIDAHAKMDESLLGGHQASETDFFDIDVDAPDGVDDASVSASPHLLYVSRLIYLYILLCCRIRFRANR